MVVPVVLVLLSLTVLLQTCYGGSITCGVNETLKRAHYPNCIPCEPMCDVAAYVECLTKPTPKFCSNDEKCFCKKGYFRKHDDPPWTPPMFQFGHCYLPKDC